MFVFRQCGQNFYEVRNGASVPELPAREQGIARSLGAGNRVEVTRVKKPQHTIGGFTEEFGDLEQVNEPARTSASDASAARSAIAATRSKFSGVKSSAVTSILDEECFLAIREVTVAHDIHDATLNRGRHQHQRMAPVALGTWRSPGPRPSAADSATARTTRSPDFRGYLLGRAMRFNVGGARRVTHT